MENKIYYTIKLIEFIETEELDFVLYDEILGEKWEDHDKNQIGNFNSDSCPIKINTLLSVLKEFKDKGANYVSIDENCDHHSYEFNLYDIHKSSKEEINEYLLGNKVDKYIYLQKQIKLMEFNLEKAKKELEILKKEQNE